MMTLLLLVSVVFVSCTTIPATTTPEDHEREFRNQDETHEHVIVSELPFEDVSEEEAVALIAALDDEYKAYSTYKVIIETFGEVKPFSNIILAEQSHINSLIEIFNKYNITVPENNWEGQVPPTETILEACQIGVTAEIENAALYEELFASVDNQDIIAVFTALQAASQEKHLNSFQRCVDRQGVY